MLSQCNLNFSLYVLEPERVHLTYISFRDGGPVFRNN
jgi:hypothetical protein